MKDEHRRKLVNSIMNDLNFIGVCDEYVERSLALLRIMDDIRFLKRDVDTFFRIRKGWDQPEDERKIIRVLNDIIDIDDRKIRVNASTEFAVLLLEIGYFSEND